jgi:hypothetical protein
MAQTRARDLAAAIESVVEHTLECFERERQWTPRAEAALHHAFAQVLQARRPGLTPGTWPILAACAAPR